MFHNLRLRKRLQRIGSSVDVSYLLYLNNLEPISFPSQDDCFQYIKNFRNENVIFKLQIYRIETYSL